jgi:hypothetical protein
MGGPQETRAWSPAEREAGLGRNVALFDALRFYAYREVGKAKTRGGSMGEWSNHLLDVASNMNESLNFSAPLPFQEVRWIVKSVSKWTWNRYSPKRYSARQSARGMYGNRIRWAGHVSLDKTRPWEAEGISRRTYFNRQKAKKANS